MTFLSSEKKQKADCWSITTARRGDAAGNEHLHARRREYAALKEIESFGEITC